MIIQTYLSPAAGKRLIAKGLAAREDVQTALKEHTILIIKIHQRCPGRGTAEALRI